MGMKTWSTICRSMTRLLLNINMTYFVNGQNRDSELL